MFYIESEISHVYYLFQYGLTPLHLASSSGMVDTITELVQLGADITAKDSVRYILIHHLIVLYISLYWGRLFEINDVVS